MEEGEGPTSKEAKGRREGTESEGREFPQCPGE